MMQAGSAYILLEELHFHAFHGVMPQESKVGGDFLLSLRLGYDISKAMQTDRVEDTLNYAEVYAVVKEEMEKPSASWSMSQGVSQMPLPHISCK